MKQQISIALMILMAASAAGAQQGLPYVQRLHTPSLADDFGDPRAVTADPHTSEIFICDIRKNRVLIFDKQGLFLYQIPGGDVFRAPRDLAVDPEGYILLLATHQEKVGLIRLDFDGKFLESIPLTGLPETASEPHLVSVAMSPEGDQFYLMDQANLRLWITDREGKLSTAIDLEVEVNLPEGEAQEQVLGHVDVYGNRVVVATPSAGTVYLFDLDGNPTGHVGVRGTAPCQTMFPIAAALTDDDHAVIVDQQRMLIMIWDVRNNKCLGEYSGIGNAPGYVYRPSDMALDGEGRVYVTQGFEGRVQVFAGSMRAP
jgi:DNA-binding beta-propeller fold protein YncE